MEPAFELFLMITGLTLVMSLALTLFMMRLGRDTTPSGNNLDAAE